jgi:hypothetical protein
MTVAEWDARRLADQSVDLPPRVVGSGGHVEPRFAEPPSDPGAQLDSLPGISSFSTWLASGQGLLELLPTP